MCDADGVRQPDDVKSEEHTATGEPNHCKDLLKYYQFLPFEKMNSVTSCIVLLACVTLCFSASILNCRCLNTVTHVNKTLIVGVREYKPRPYCNKHEVIVMLKNNESRCLDPDSEFTKALLKIKAKRDEMKKNQAKPTKAKITRAQPTTPFHVTDNPLGGTAGTV